MGSLSISPTRVSQQGGQAQITLGGQYNEMYKYTIYGPNGVDIVDFTGWNGDNRLGSDGGEEPSGLTRFFYTANFLPAIGTYTVTVDFSDSYPSSVSKTFRVISQAEYDTPFITYPDSVKQGQRFNWTIENAVPGESCTIHAVGPITFDVGPILVEGVYLDNDYSNILGVAHINDSYYDYDGTYTVTWNFSRSKSITKTINVTQKLSIANYPASVVTNQEFTYTLSGGNAGELWAAHMSGPVTWDVADYLNSGGSFNYNAAFTTAGEYDVVWTFPQSGKIKKHITVIDGGGPTLSNLEIKSGGELSFSEINAVFQVGTDENTYQNRRWYLRNGDYGNFDVNSLDFSEFYNKRAVDPAVPGSVYYGAPGSYSFIVPLHRNGITIQAWGGGGGNGQRSIKAEDTNVYFPGNHMFAGGGTGSGGGGRRYFSPGGNGGTASGGHENINGNSGGNDMGAFVKGGTGATAPNGGAGGAGGTPYGVNPANGNAPGGGGGGVTWRDYSSSPGYGGAGGGGSGAYCAVYSVGLATGTQIDFNVGGGAHDSYSAGGDGAVRISWS